MPAADDILPFFLSLQDHFAGHLAARGPQGDAIAALTQTAYLAFDRAVDAYAADQPPLACHAGCAPCCVLRVVATAPEVFAVARAIRTLATPDAVRAVAGRLFAADEATRERSEAERLADQTPCPYLHETICTIYAARPLACRGHAAYDKAACEAGLAGRDGDLALAVVQRDMRGIVQNALQSAMRQAGLAWGVYELNHATAIALADEETEADWLAGRDPLAEAAVVEVPEAEMAATFDALNNLRPPAV